MKDKESKKKIHESKIGRIIYGFLLFMPLFAIGITCGYVIFNKNAKNSYYGETINDSEVISVNSSNLQVNEHYTFNSVSALTYVGTSTFTINVTDFERTYPTHNADYSNVNRLIFKPSNNAYYVFLYRDNTYVSDTNLNTNFVNMSFTYISSTGTLENDYQFFSTIRYNKDSFLSEVFYYSVNRVTQSNYFNWVTSSNIYTGITNFTQAMSVTNTFLPMLLTYWLIISVIYFLYDIILVLLTVLHRKIHQLQESI